MINVQIESKQREFFGLLCLHSFYSDNVTRDLEFEPTLETASQLKNYGLVFKAIPFGFLVLYNPDNSIEKLREMPKGMRFSFRIKNTNPNFMNFSHIPFWPEGEVFHYSNAKINRQDLPFNPTKDIYYYFRNLRLGDVRKNVLNLPEHPLVSLRSKKFNMQVGGKDEDGVNYNSIRIVDEKGDEVPIGEAGELIGKGPQIMKGYYRKPEETAKTIKDGWLYTGDIGVMEADGYFKIVDRKKDMILVSGFNVYPNEIEDVLATHPKILEAAAIGVADEKSGECVKVFIVKRDNSLDESEVMDFARENLTGYKCPKYIEFRKELPKTNVGKVLRKELRQ